MKPRVWHYFSEEEDPCWFKNPCHVPAIKTPVTLCGERLSENMRHTEYREQVTCRTCLRRIVLLESPREMKRSAS